MQILVSNNIRMYDVPVPLRATITAALTIPNPVYVKLKKLKKPTWGVDDKLQLFTYDADGSLVLPRGYLGQLRDLLRSSFRGFKFPAFPANSIKYAYTDAPVVDFGTWQGPKLRDYQEAATFEILSRNGGVLVSPAGSGKTLMGIYSLLLWGLPALWLTHTKDLLYQSAEAAEKYLEGVGTVGIFGDGKQVSGCGKLYVATVQTLKANSQIVSLLNDRIGTLIVDECHHFPANQFIETAGKFAARYVLGLTATPDRKDGLEQLMYMGLGPKCYEVKRDGMYEAGAIILPEVKFIFSKFTDEDEDRAENNVDAGGEDLDYSALIKDLIADEARAKLVAENVLESCIECAPKGGAVIVLADSVRYLFKLRDLVQQFAGPRLGVTPRMAVVHGGITQKTWRRVSRLEFDQLKKSGYAVRLNERLRRYEEQVTQYTDEEMTAWKLTSKQRQEVMAQARNREIDIIFATSQLVKEGVDIPHLYHGHLATPQRGDAFGNKSGSGVEQAIGRIMRPDPQNPTKKAVWYDYVDGNVGVFIQQYYSRRAVYKRLGITVPRRQRSQNKMIEDFLVSGGPFSGLPL